MKPIQIHPLSALAGAGVLALVLLGTGIAAPQGGGTQRMFIENDPAQAFGVIDPHEVVTIDNSTWAGAPYIVPAGKAFVLIALSTIEGGVFFHVDGEQWANAVPDLSTVTLRTVPSVLVVGEGRLIQVTTSMNGSAPTAFGYLIDA